MEIRILTDYLEISQIKLQVVLILFLNTIDFKLKKSIINYIKTYTGGLSNEFKTSY